LRAPDFVADFLAVRFFAAFFVDFLALLRAPPFFAAFLAPVLRRDDFFFGAAGAELGAIIDIMSAIIFCFSCLGFELF
jgi:hypothetical protein